MFVVYTTIPFDPNRREELLEHVTELVTHSQREDGTVRYHAVEDVTDPDVLRFFEQYEDAAAAEAHTESDPYRRFTRALPEVVDGPIESVRFETDDFGVAEFTATDAVDALD